MAALFAARLAAAGLPTALLGTWPAGLESIRQQGGVYLEEADGRGAVYPVAVYAPAEAGPGAPAAPRPRFALVLVKSWQTARAAHQLAAVLAEDGLALTLQNGWGNYELLAAALGEERVALGVTTAGATLLGPGRVRAAGHGPITLGGNPAGSPGEKSAGAHPGEQPAAAHRRDAPAATQRLATLAGWLAAAGFEVHTAPDVAGLLWGKLVINAAINPLTALLGVPNGALLERPAARELLAAAAQESAAVAAAQGIRLPYPDPVAAAEGVAASTAANCSSMLQDVRRGAPTEIDAICGAIVQAGERAGLPTPVNRTLWQLIKSLVS